MELGIGMYIFFIVTTIVGVAIGLLFSVEDLSGKLAEYFKEEDKKINY